MQIERCNYARAAHAPISLKSCRRLKHDNTAADLSHYGQMKAGLNHGSLHEACAFNLTPVKLAGECKDKDSCVGTPRDCIDAEFRDHLHHCPKLCAQCGMCVDQHISCQEWSAAGQCSSNPGFMLDQCPHACIRACSIMYDPHPPFFISLWNGLLMPTIGFGTAGLSTGTTDAVLAALEVGFRYDTLRYVVAAISGLKQL